MGFGRSRSGTEGFPALGPTRIAPQQHTNTSFRDCGRLRVVVFFLGFLPAFCGQNQACAGGPLTKPGSSNTQEAFLSSTNSLPIASKPCYPKRFLLFNRKTRQMQSKDTTANNSLLFEGPGYMHTHCCPNISFCLLRLLAQRDDVLLLNSILSFSLPRYHCCCASHIGSSNPGARLSEVFIAWRGLFDALWL